MPQNRRAEGVSVSSLPLRRSPRDLDKFYLLGYNDQGILVDYTIEYKDLINSVKNTYSDLKFEALINSIVARGNWLLDAVFEPWEVLSTEFDNTSNLLVISFRDKGTGTYPNFINKRLYVQQGSNNQSFIINRSNMVGYSVSLATDISLVNSAALFHFTHLTDALGSAVSDTYARPLLWFRGTTTPPDAPSVYWGEYGFNVVNLGGWVDDPSKLSGEGVDWISYGSFYNHNKSWSGLPWLVRLASDSNHVLYSLDGNNYEAGHYPMFDTDNYVKFLIADSNWTPWIKFRGIPDDYTQIYSSPLKLDAYDSSLVVDILPFDLRMYSSYKFVFEWVTDILDPATSITRSEATLGRSILTLSNNNTITYNHGATVSLYWSILYEGAANLCNFDTNQNSIASADNTQFFKLNFNRVAGDLISNTVTQLAFYDPGLINEDGYVYILAR